MGQGFHFHFDYHVTFLGAARTIVAGGVGGMCLWSAIFPTDVVKSRIQVESTVGKKAPGFLVTFNHILKSEGKKKKSVNFDVH